MADSIDAQASFISIDADAPHTWTDAQASSRLSPLPAAFPTIDLGHRDAGRLGFVDFDADDSPQPCGQCPEWRSDVISIDGGPVLREWHDLTCPTYLEWAQ